MSRFTLSLAVAVCMLSSIARATPYSRAPCNGTYDPFLYTGCYADNTSTPALVFRSTLDTQNMTIDVCTAECKGNGYKYAGIEYYGECFCGQTINGAELPNSDCTYACSGNQSEICGGYQKLSVYRDPTFVNNGSDVTDDDYKYLGCYSDDSSLGRTLSWQMNIDSTNLTTEACLTACRQANYPFAGTEYGDQCWCGVVLSLAITANSPASDCNMACSGNSSEICGADDFLSLYVAPELESNEPCGYTEPSIPTTSTTTTSPTSTATPTTTTTTTTPTTTTTTTTPTTTTTTTTPTITTTTTTPTTTTTTPTTTRTTPTTTTASVCTTTTTTPPKCEFQCGNWCAPPVPDWQDVSGCQDSYRTCYVQISSCFKQAGWPGSMQCFDYQKWCIDIQGYCQSDCPGGSCNKRDCWQKCQPQGGNGGTTTTSTIPCSSRTATTLATTTSSLPSTSCPPEPSNICTQPSSQEYGFGPGQPVGGISLPLLACNDIQSQWQSHPLKLYIGQDNSQCPSYTSENCPSACAVACNEQYQECLGVYVKACQENSWGSKLHKREAATEHGVEARGGGGEDDGDNCGCKMCRSTKLRGTSGGEPWDNSGQPEGSASPSWSNSGWPDGSLGKLSGGDTAQSAQEKCEAQYQGCLASNQYVNAGSRCTTWGTGW